MQIDDLIERVRGLTGSSEEVDALIRLKLLAPADAYVEQSKFNSVWCIYRRDFIGRVSTVERPRNVPQAVWAGEYTRDLTAAAALVEHVLPGWWWRVGTCCVSDDACIAPDFNSPVHGERLKAQFFPLVAGSEFDAGFDVDRRPPGNVPIALIEALLIALAALPHSKEGGKP